MTVLVNGLYSARQCRCVNMLRVHSLAIVKSYSLQYGTLSWINTTRILCYSKDYMTIGCKTSRSEIFIHIETLPFAVKARASFRPSQGTYGLWAATLAMTRCLGFCGFIRKTASISRRKRQAKCILRKYSNSYMIC